MGEEVALQKLKRDERMLLMRYVCSFAWADSRIRPEERALVARYIAKLRLDAREAAQVRAWLEQPPPGLVDPKLVPAEHRAVFVHALESIVSVDGEIAPAERERLIELARLLR